VISLQWSLTKTGRFAGLIAIAVLQIYWYLQPGPLLLKILTAVFTVVCLASSAMGLTAFAALAPVSSVIVGLAGGSTGGMGALLLEQFVLAIGVATLVRPGAAGERTRIAAPAFAVAVVALASAASMVPAAAAAAAPPGLENDQYTFLRLLLSRSSAHNSSVWAPVFAAITVAECCLLGWTAERMVRRMPQLARQLVTISLAGHAAAALLNIEAVVRMAKAIGGGLGSLPGVLMTARVSMQTDVHAAASALLLAGIAGFGLLTGSRVRRASVSVLLVVTGAGLWITGSRTAIALGGLATALAVIAWTLRSRRRFLVAGAAVATIGAGVWIATLYPSVRYSAPSTSLNSRLVMARVSIELFEQAPVFGIGIARFYGASAAVAGQQIAGFSRGPRENAHNNFLQVLTEQGVIGLAAMVWWLGIVVLGGWRDQLAQPDSLRAALLLAVTACIGTWLMGHPLLVPEFALVFWFYSGILLATTQASTTARSHRLAWLFVAAMLVSVPVRAAALRNAAELDHLGFGLSLWESDDERRYRQARADFAIYLPAQDKPVTVPIRRAPGVADPLLVDIRIRGRVVQTLTVAGDAWLTPAIVVPQRARRFELVDFEVREPSSARGTHEVLLRVGRAEFR